MADNISTLGIEVKTSGVAQAASDLQKLSQAATSAEKSTGNITSGIDKVNAQLSAMGNKAKGAGTAFKALDPVAQTLGKVAKEADNASGAMSKIGSNQSLGKIGADASKAADGIRKASNELDRFTKESKDAARSSSGMSEVFSSLQRVAGGLFAGFSIAQFAGKLITVQREFDKLNSSLITITGSSSKAEREFAWIKDFAAETPFSLTEVTTAFVKLKNLGLDATKESLISYGNTASAMGKSLDQMIEAVADASTGEFERLKEFGIRARKSGDEVSLTFQGVTKTVKNSAEEIGRYLTEIGNNNFAGAMAERAKTLDGAISNLGDSWDDLFRTINTNSVGGIIFDSVKLATGAIGELAQIIRVLGADYGTATKETGAFTSAQNGLKTVFETVAVLGMNVSFVLKQIGADLGALAAAAQQVISLNFRAAAQIRAERMADAQQARAELDAAEKRLFGRGKFNNDFSALSDGLDPVKPKSSGIASIGSPKKRGGGGRSVSEKESAEAKAYEDAMSRLAGIQRDANKSTLDLTASQAALYDLMASPAWVSMPESWKQTALAQFDAARAAETNAESQREMAKAMDDGKRLTESMRTPTEELGARIVYLNGLLDKGAISWETYSRAVFEAQDKVDKAGGDKLEKAKSDVDILDEYAKSAARNIQSSFADFLFDPFDKGVKGMAQEFGKILQRMAAEAAAAQIMKGLFGSMGGKDGKGDWGWIGSAASWLVEAFGFHKGGIVGAGGASFTRAVHPMVFANAERFHDGGFPGLKRDEVPAILQRGEQVLTKEQQRARMGNIVINVNSTTGDRAEIRRAVATGARQVLGVMGGSRRYG